MRCSRPKSLRPPSIRLLRLRKALPRSRNGSLALVTLLPIIALSAPALALPPQASTPAAAPPAASAASPAPPAPAAAAKAPLPAPTRIVELRLALSVFALRTLSEPRVRRLVEIETEDVAVLAPGSIGPLGDHVAYAWVDQPTISKIVVEVRVGDRGVDRREIAVRGLAKDVAARLVAIAISELVRAGMVPRPPPPPPPAAPRAPTADEIERASRSAPAVVLSPEAVFAGLPASSGALGGAGLALGFRSHGATASVFGRWLAGATPQSGLRWLEIGLAVDYRLWLGRSWRIGLGGSAALASLHVAEALRLGGEPGERQTLSARAGGLLAIEAKLAPATWLSLTAEPGAILRAARFSDASGGEGKIAGAWLGAGLSMRFEKLDPRAALPTP